MRSAGIIGVARPKMSVEEKKAKRKSYSKQYRQKITAEARAYREMMAGSTGTKAVARRRK